MSIKNELTTAGRDYLANPSLDALFALKEKEEAYKRTPEGAAKFREEGGDEFEASLLEKIAAFRG